VAYIVNQAGVWLPAEAPGLADWESEVGGFPLATLNDQPDALVHCLSYALRPSEYRGQKAQEELVVYDALEGGHSLDSDLDSFDKQMSDMEEKYGCD